MSGNIKILLKIEFCLVVFLHFRNHLTLKFENGIYAGMDDLALFQHLFTNIFLITHLKRFRSTITPLDPGKAWYETKNRLHIRSGLYHLITMYFMFIKMLIGK